MKGSHLNVEKQEVLKIKFEVKNEMQQETKQLSKLKHVETRFKDKKNAFRSKMNDTLEFIEIS